MTQIPESLSADSDVRPQFFVTRILGSEDLPDVEILTLPSYHSSSAIEDLEGLERLILTREYFETIGGSSIDHSANACISALHQVVIDAGIREE